MVWLVLRSLVTMYHSPVSALLLSGRGFSLLVLLFKLQPRSKVVGFDFVLSMMFHIC